MATHSSILAQKIPWTEEPGRLLSKGHKRVRHDQQLMQSGDNNGEPLHQRHFFLRALQVLLLFRNWCGFIMVNATHGCDIGSRFASEIWIEIFSSTSIKIKLFTFKLDSSLDCLFCFPHSVFFLPVYILQFYYITSCKLCFVECSTY